jgi:phage shock protein C
MQQDMPKKLYRSTTNKMIAGVCGGIAEYFNIDATVVRIIAVILLLPGGLPGFLPYVLLWIIVPEKPAGNHDDVIDV